MIIKIILLTPSWSLSSMAVDPINSKFTSINSLTLAICSSLFVTLYKAWANLSFQLLYSLTSIYLLAKSRVLNPSLAYPSINYNVSSMFWLFWRFNLSKIIESAPLVSNSILPYESSMITLILFLSLENSKIFNNLYFRILSLNLIWT